jgi:MFS family permease
MRQDACHLPTFDLARIPMPFSLRTRLSPIWQNRDFWRYWVADAISELGSSLSYFALPIVAAVTLGVTPGQMGLMRALGNIPVVFVGLIAGVWVDRVSRQRLLIWTNLAAAALVASVPLAYALNSLTVEHLFALSLAFGLLWPFWGPRTMRSCRRSSGRISSSTRTASSNSRGQRAGSPVRG